MKCYIVDGLSKGKLQRKLESGEVYKVARGFHLNRKPTPLELAYIVIDSFPGAALDGRSAAELICGMELTFPLQFAAGRRLPAGELLQSRRTTVMNFRIKQGLRLLSPLNAAAQIEDDELVVRVLETFYQGPGGKLALERDLSCTRRVPKRTRELMNGASIGCDSALERKLVGLLREQGYSVKTNHVIGHYRWDIVLPKYKVAIDVDGFAYHSAERQETFVLDRWKSNDATLRGYRVLRYAGTCVTHHSDVIVRQVNFACRRLGTLPSPAWLWHWLFASQH